MIKLIEESKRHLHNDGYSPQSYSEHRDFAIKNSFILLVSSLQGIVHGLLPFAYPYATSSALIRSFKKLIDSGRHKRELAEIMPEGYILKKHQS